MKSFGTIFTSKNGTIIAPYRKGQCRDLEHETSLWDPVYHKSMELTGFFVTNFGGGRAFITHNRPVSYLKSYFPGYDIQSLPKTPAYNVNEPFALKDEITLREIQGDVISKLLATPKNITEWFINMQTSMGKTVAGVYLSAYFHRKTMIVCFKKDVLTQWVNTYIEKTTIDPKRLLGINDGKMLDAIRYNNGEWKKNRPNLIDDFDIYFVSPGMLTGYIGRHDCTDLIQIFNNLGIGLLIFDEAHHNMGAMVKINALSNVESTLYLSAEFTQGNYKREEKFYRIFDNAAVLQPDAALVKSMKYTSIIVVDYNTHPSDKEILEVTTKYGYNAQRYMSYQLKRGYIFKVLEHLMKLILDSRKPEYKALFLVTNIAHADMIYEFLKDSVPSKELRYGRYHSQMPNEERQATLNYANVIISTYASFGVGNDLENIKYVVSLNQCNKVEDNQAAGRARPLFDGSNAIYFMVTDVGFKYCRDKLRVRLGYIMETKSENDKPTVYHL